MKYAVAFHALALLLVYTGTFGIVWIPAQVACLATAVSLVWVGFIYGLRQPVLFGKTPAGNVRWSAWLMLAPYFFLTRLTLAIVRLVNHRQPALGLVWLAPQC